MTVQFTGYVGSDKPTLIFENVVYFGLHEDDVWFIRQRSKRSYRSKITTLSLDDYCIDYCHSEGSED